MLQRRLVLSWSLWLIAFIESDNKPKNVTIQCLYKLDRDRFLSATNACRKGLRNTLDFKLDTYLTDLKIKNYFYIHYRTSRWNVEIWILQVVKLILELNKCMNDQKLSKNFLELSCYRPPQICRPKEPSLAAISAKTSVYYIQILQLKQIKKWASSTY